MPYLQMSLKEDLNVEEAQQALAFLRDHFPLQQSEGRLLRMTSSFALFEQPEHEVLTLEQELWLEKHAQEIHIGNTWFYQDTTEGCRMCNHPFDDSPTGYCPQCHRVNHFQITSLQIPLVEAEDAYLGTLAQQVCGGRQNIYLRLLILTFLDLYETGLIEMKTVLASDQASFAEKASIFFQAQQTTCFLCGLPDEQCTCKHSTFRYNYRAFANTLAWKQEHVVTILLPHQQSRRFQEIAKQHGLTVDALVRHLVELPDLQIAVASREATAGQVLSVDFAFHLARITEQAVQGFPQSGSIRAIGDAVGNTFSPTLFALGGLAASIAVILPLLESFVPALLFGQQHDSDGENAFLWVQKQLELCDVLATQQARLCSLQEIGKLEALAGGSFPAVYRAFLEWMGHGAGDFLRYLTCFASDLPGLQTGARELLVTDHCQTSLPADAWVMAMVAGQHFTFFCLSEGDDPPVYAYRSAWRRTPFCKIAHHMSDFFRIQIALYAEYRQHGTFRSFLGNKLRTRFLTMAPRIEAVITDHQKQ